MHAMSDVIAMRETDDSGTNNPWKALQHELENVYGMFECADPIISF
jgi:hypothetical protein